MNGLYVHVPFCKSKCYYCDFYSVTNSAEQADFSGLISQEVDFRENYLADKSVDTLYFGGGTPTLLSPEQLNDVLNKFKLTFRVDKQSEITIEANPDDLTSENLKAYKSLGFNRISIGTQSFFDEHLLMMNRRHTADQAKDSITMAHDLGFQNISIDLIYGIPGMTMDQWIANLEIAIKLPANHVSAYHLSIEPGTKFGRLKRAGKLFEISDDDSVDQYKLLREIMLANGFEHYEISNFAKPGYYSRHNSKYWNGEAYLGLGPSAHSFNGHQRHWNPANLKKYINDVKDKRIPKGEIINAVTKRNEYVMTHLRTSKGIDGRDFQALFGESEWLGFLAMAEKYLINGQLQQYSNRVWFDSEAWFYSDGILSDLFIVQ